MKKTTTTTKAPAKTKAAKTTPTTPAPKRVRKPKAKAKVHSLPPGEEAKQMAAGQAASPMLQEKLAKAKASQATVKIDEVVDATPGAVVKTSYTIPVLNPAGTGIVTKRLEQRKANTPSVSAQRTQDQLRILTRDLEAASMNLFRHWVDVSGVMGDDAVETLDLFPSPGSTCKKDEANLMDLKKHGLLDTFTGADDVTWVGLTKLGQQVKEYLADLANPPVPVAPRVVIPVAKQVMVKPVAAPAPKRVPALKINRMQVRYEAVTFCMAKVKPAEFSKLGYEPLMAEIELKFAPLYSKLKTPEKVRAYSTGIIDFCLAACRKNHLRSNA